MATDNLYVNAAGSVTSWDFPIFNPHYEQVDETSQDGDTTYIADNGIFVPNGTGPKDYFNIDAWTNGAQFIEKVEVIFWAKLSEGSGKVTPALHLSGTSSYGTLTSLTNSYVEYTEEISKPGGGNWLYTDFADLEVGVQASNGGGSKLGYNIRVTQIYVKVTYHDNFSDIALDGHVEWPWPTNLYLTDNSSDLGDGDGYGRFDKDLEEDADTRDTEDITLTKTVPKTCYGFTKANVPNNDDWETGTLAVKVEIYFIDYDDVVSLRVSASRVNSSGVVQESTSWSPSQVLDESDWLGENGVYGFLIPSKNWSSGDVGDRLRINYEYTYDSGPSGSTTIIVYFNHADSVVGTHVVWHRIDEINFDGHIKFTGTDTIELDGHIASGTVTETDTIELDGHILLTDTDGIDLNGHILLTDSDAINLDGHIKLVDTDGIDLSGHIILTGTDNVSLDGHILLTSTDGVNLNGHIILTGDSSINHDGHILLTNTDGIDLSGHILLTDSDAVSLDGHIVKTASAVIDVNGHVIVTTYNEIALNGYVALRESVTIQLAGHVTDRAIGKNSGKGWFNKIGKSQRTEFWTRR